MANDPSNSSLLEELNQEEARQYLGGVVFVSLLMIAGIIGNVHVLLVYALRIKPSNHRIFILILAALDLTTCLVGMPFIIVDLRNPLTFTLTSACKLLRFINYFITECSGLILLVIAVDRYRKICVPLGRQLSRKMALAFCGLMIVIAVLLSWPAPVLFGDNTVETRYPDVTGVRCYTEDRFVDTKYMLYFNASLIVQVIIVFIAMVVLYVLIGRAISRQTRFQNSAVNVPRNGRPKKSQTNSAVDSSLTNDTTVSSSSEVGKASKPDTSNANNNANGQTTFNGDAIELQETKSNTSNATTNDVMMSQDTVKEKKGEKTKDDDRVRRTTFIFFLITTVFFVSYFPHLILKILTFTKDDFVANMSFTGKVLYNTFIWCFFINNMANSIIYGFCDNRFRRELRKGYTSILNKILCRK